MSLAPDTAELSRFFGALFRYADEGTFVSLRAFHQSDRGQAPILIEGVPVNGSPDRIIARAVAAAARAANGDKPAVFAPPVATFRDARKAGAAHLANGVALSVELDEGSPVRARAKLDMLLGRPTLVVQSGSEWLDPDTGELHPKVHFHWRLTEPTRTDADHAKLREARWLAAVLVGADRSAAPPVHPLRWPGSWNLKRRPRLARIVECNEAAEIHLDDALAALQEAVEAAGLMQAGIAGRRTPGQPQAPLADVAAALAHVANPDLSWDDWNRMGMAVWRATGGSEEGRAVWADWSAKSGKHDEQACLDRWAHFAASPPNRIGAGTIFFLARAAGWRRQAEDPPPPDPDPGWEPDPFPDAGEAEAPPHNAQPEPPRSARERPSAFRVCADDWAEAAIPKRKWIAPGYIMRGAVSLIGGPGSAGKSSYIVACTAALALNMDYGDFKPIGREPHRVLTVNMEDDEDEQRRRYSAALRQFERTPQDFAGRVIRAHPKAIGTLIEQDQATGMIRFTDAWHDLEDLIEEHQPDVVVLDPLVELHTAGENDNTALRLVIAHLRALAQRRDCAVVLVHHTRKGGMAGDPESLRGASSIVGACRIVLTVTPMTVEEADEVGVPRDRRRSFFRVDSAKANYSPASEARWHEMVAWPLANGEDVAAAEPWFPNAPPRAKGPDPEVVALICAEAERGTPHGPYSPRLAPDQARSIAAVMARHGIEKPAAQKALLNTMLAQGFTVQEYRNKDRVRRSGLRAPSGRPAATWEEGAA